MGSWVFLGGVGDRIWSLRRKRKYLPSRQFSDLIMFSSPWEQTCSQQANGGSPLCSSGKAAECQGHKDVCPTQHQSNYKRIVNGKVGAHSVPKGADGRPGFFMPFPQGNVGILLAFILIPFALCLAPLTKKSEKSRTLTDTDLTPASQSLPSCSG